MTFNDQKTQKNSKSYDCSICDFKSNNKNDYRRHCDTIKHQNMINDDYDDQKNFKNSFACSCGKKYKYKQGLSTHKKRCNFKEKEENKIVTTESPSEIKDMFMKVMEENKELRKTISDMVPKLGNTTNNTINNKQKFNINVFLNEKCKDAISMDQFIDKIEVTMKNLLTTKDKGLGIGLSNIIIDNMNKLSLYERPMHCTDKKRETLYIKNEEWEKDEKNEHINELLKKVEKKQMKNINKWTQEHPDFQADEKLQEEYINLIKGCTSSIEACKDKAIKKVCENIHIHD